MPKAAPKEMVGTSDATWSAGEEGDMDVYALALTHNGAAIIIELKKIGVATGCSAAAELLGMLKLVFKAQYGRTLLMRLGVKLGGPTPVLCDNDATLRVAHGEATVSRLKHELRRAAIVTQYVHEGDVALVHVPDAANYVDFLTKWLKADKVEASVNFLTGAKARAMAKGTEGQLQSIVAVTEWLRATAT